jgi:hypothetical protein
MLVCAWCWVRGGSRRCRASCDTGVRRHPRASLSAPPHAARRGGFPFWGIRSPTLAAGLLQVRGTLRAAAAAADGAPATAQVLAGPFEGGADAAARAHTGGVPREERGSGNGRGRGLYACDSRAVPEAAHSQEDWLEDEGAPRGRRWRWPRRGAWSGLSKRLSVRKERCVLHRPGPEACRSRRTRGLPVLCSLLHSAPPALRGRSSARQAASASAQTAGSTCVSSAAACARPRAS